MDTVVTDRPPFATYAEPLAGLKVSWGSVLAGAVAGLAVALLLWLLVAAITFAASNPTADSVRGALTALVVASVITTLIGSAIGGLVAGFLPGNPSRLIGGAHGFLAWALAFLVASAVEWGMINGIAGTAKDAILTTTSAAVQTAGAAAGGVAGGQLTLDQKATSLLTSLGYTPAEAQEMVQQAQAQIQRVLRGQPVVTEGQTQEATAQFRGAMERILDGMSAASWTWFGTWLIAAALSTAAGLLATDRLRREVMRARPATPLVTPPETTPPRGGPRQPIQGTV